MTSMEYFMSCPDCFMEKCMNVIITKTATGYQCSANPNHKFTLDINGLLRKA
ncbi:hypothetical protein JXA56_05905 [Candidatus Micrarchaeota archaeon]|nr:hypothetical protein [Candidatus Micrarchaeota archaeon]